jgi:toxin HigB-1
VAWGGARAGANRGARLAGRVHRPVFLSGLTLDVNNGSRYAFLVIRSFRDAETRRLFHREPVKRWAPRLRRAALRKLVMLDAAESLGDLRVPPGNRLEKLSGDRAGQHSIRVNDQWRLCFRWRDGDAHDVELVDYH